MTLFSEAECLLDSRCLVGESPVWDERLQAILWCDCLGRMIFQLEMETRAFSSWPMPTELGSFGLCASGRLVIALRDRICLFDRSGASLTTLAAVPQRKFTRLNDGKCGPDGAFWVGSLDERDQKEPVGALYRIDPSGKVESKGDGFIISNGLAWSPDGSVMYHSDSRGPWIDAYQFDVGNGSLSGRRRLATPGDRIGRPDGAAVDCDGNYWSCGVSAGCVNVFSPEGDIIERQPTPVPAPTMLCFGGTDYRTLFLTSLRLGKPQWLLEQFPQSGSLFMARSEVAGSPISRFADA